MSREFTVNGQWDSYRKVLPSNAGIIQLKETKRAFFAGAKAFMYLVNKASELPEDQAVVLMEIFNAELEQFGKAVQEGDA